MVSSMYKKESIAITWDTWGTVSELAKSAEDKCVPCGREYRELMGLNGTRREGGAEFPCRVPTELRNFASIASAFAFRVPTCSRDEVNTRTHAANRASNVDASRGVRLAHRKPTRGGSSWATVRATSNARRDTVQKKRDQPASDNETEG